MYSHLPSSKTAQVRVKRDLHGPCYSTEGKSEPVFEHLGSLVLWDVFKKVHFCLAPSRTLGCTAQGGQEGLGRTAASSVRGHQRTPSLLTTSQSPTRSLSMSFWASPHLAHRHPQCSERDTIALHLHPVPNSLSPTLKAARESLCR